jgi:hypothetical protein
MREDCLELLAKFDKCMEDPDFQLIIIMKFLRNLTPYLQLPVVKGDNNERNDKRIIM